MQVKSQSIRTTIISAVAFAALAGFSGLATAQSAAPAAPAQSAAHTDENTVQTFAVALAAVKDVQTEYIEKIKAANEPDVATRLQHEAQSEMVKAVETKGLSVNQYNSLAQQMQADPGFRQRVERAMQK